MKKYTNFVKPDKFDIILVIAVIVFGSSVIIMDVYARENDILYATRVAVESILSRLAYALIINFILLPKFLKSYKLILLFPMVIILGIVLTTLSILSYFDYQCLEMTCFLNMFLNINLQGGIILCFFIAKQFWGFNKRIQEMELQKTQTELQILKSQINPHFYFNTLNNIYGLSIRNSDLTSNAILKLSDIMQYIIYDCNQEQVALIKEIKYIQDYIELEKLRYDKKNNIQININLSKEVETLQIAPMILFPFVENVFKHVNKNESGEWFVNIKIVIHKNSIVLHTKNSAIKNLLIKNNNIGLNNTNRRLNLLYQDKHDLYINVYDNEFELILTLNL